MMEPAPQDIDLDAFEAQLKKRQARLDAYMRYRGYGLGIALLALGAASAVLTLVAVLVALGALSIPVLEVWTQDQKVVLAIGVPAALTFIFLKSGLVAWRERDPRTADPPDWVDPREAAASSATSSD